MSYTINLHWYSTSHHLKHAGTSQTFSELGAEANDVIELSHTPATLLEERSWILQSRILTGNEERIHHLMLTSKAASIESMHTTSPMNKLKNVQSAGKILSSSFCDAGAFSSSWTTGQH
jgi:hypothetical protein